MTADSSTAYDVPTTTREVLHKLVTNPRLSIPDSVRLAAESVTIEGSALPFLPLPHKYTEAISALKALEAGFILAIARARFPDTSFGRAVVNTDHAALFTFSPFQTTINGLHPKDVIFSPDTKVKDIDIYENLKYRYRVLCTNIYKTKDGRFYHLHGSLNARPSSRCIGVNEDDVHITDEKEITQIYADKVAKWNAAELDRAINNEYKQAGCICYSFEEFQQLEAGKAILNCPIYELSKIAPSAPVAWPKITTQRGALSGLKVLELTRIIAGPAIGRGLAEHGAIVLRITSDTIPDSVLLQPDMQRGKYNAQLDLKTSEGRDKLIELIKDADVFIDGYRPGALGRLGFSSEGLREINPSIILARENTYGWHGPWAHRSGWQQIGDALTGLAVGFGQKLGLPDGEAVVPIFPNSDFGAGMAGLLGVLHALYLRSTEGGVYNADTALSYYNLLIEDLGYYPDSVWEEIKPKATLRHYMDLAQLQAAVVPDMMAQHADIFTSKTYWREIDAPRFGGRVRTVSPVVRIDGLEIGFGRAPVQNGDDEPEWPRE